MFFRGTGDDRSSNSMLSRLKIFFTKGDRRTASAKKNIAAMFALRGISMLCSLLIVPLTINYVSKYEYGIWLTISSLVGWISFFDLGIGNGLRNKFIQAIETGKHKLAKVYVSTSYAIISLVVGTVWAVAVAISFSIDWPSALNATATLSSELLWTVVIVLTNFSLIFILNLNRALLNAIQKPAISSVFDTSTQALLCLVLLILVKTTSGSLVYLAVAMGGTSLLVLVASNVWTFRTLLRKYRPSLKSVRFRMAKGIMTTGLNFLFIQIIAIAFYQTNNLIISHYAGPSEVTVYNIAYKYMQLLSMGFTIIITPFWSAYAEANVNGDYGWMKKTTRKLIRLMLLLIAIGIVMIAVSPLFYKLWLKGLVEVPFIVTILVCGYHLANIWSTLWTQLLCGFGKIRLQTIMSTLCCLSYLPLAIFGCRAYGIVGLLTASLISFTAFTSWFGIIQVRKLINRTATGIWNK